LRHVEGASLEEVASACHCSLATAKRRIAMADKYMRSDEVLSQPVVSLHGPRGRDSGSAR
jgi:hypothetical protein